MAVKGTPRKKQKTILETLKCLNFNSRTLAQNTFELRNSKKDKK